VSVRLTDATIEIWRAGFHADQRAELGAIAIPVLIVHGTADQSAPIGLTGRRSAKLVPGNIYKEYRTAGHGLYVTHAAQLNADLLDFIKN